MKNCNNCGAVLEDDAVFCASCGQTQGNVSTQENMGFNMGADEPYNSFNSLSSSPKKKSKLPLILGIVGGVVALATIIIVLVVVLGGKKESSNSAEGIVKKYLKSYKKLDIEAMLDCVAASEDYKEEFEDMKDEMEYLSAMSSMIEIDYKMGKVKKVSKDEAEEFWEEAEWNDVMVDESDVSELSACEATLTMSAMGMKEDTEMTIYVGKYKGKWKIICAE